MATDQHKKLIDAQLLDLVRDDVQPASRFGVYLTICAVTLSLVIFIIISRFITVENRKTETDTLISFNETLTYRIENRLQTLSDQIGKHAQFWPMTDMCSDFLDDFSRYPELVELSLVDSQGRVQHTCPNPSSLGETKRPRNHLLPSGPTTNAIAQALSSHSATYSLPYSLHAKGSPFTDLVLPSPTSTRSLIARISLPALLRITSDGAKDPAWHFSFAIDGQRLSVENNTPWNNDFVVERLVPPLPAGVTLRISSSHMSFFYNHALFAWGLVFLFALLVLSFLCVLRYQFKQIYGEEQMRARVIVQQALSRSYSDGVLVVNRNGKILYVNEALEAMFGFSEDALVGTFPPFPYWPEERRDILTKQLERDDVQLLFHGCEYRARKIDGTPVDCSVRVQNLLSDDNRNLGYLITYRDITQEKKAHAELALTYERTTRVLETIDEAISILSIDSASPEMLYANSSYMDMFGSNTAPHIRLRELYLQLPRDERLEGVVFDTVTERWFSVHIKIITWIDGRGVEALTFSDVTARKNLELIVEQQLKNAEQSARLITMGEMASSLAHELNQPLAAVQNYASATMTLLNAGKLRPDGLQTSLSQIINQTQRAAQIMRRIRGFAKRSEPTFSNVTVQKLVDETIELAQIPGKKLGMKIETDIAENLPSLICDSVLIEQVLINLLKNAMEASENSPTRSVWLKVRANGTNVVFSVIDNGSGISPEVRKKLFEPFFSTKPAGMGIGLNICRSIVESHHGRLTIEDNPAGGAIMCITLPCASAALQSEHC